MRVLIIGSTSLLGSALHFSAPKSYQIAGTVLRNRYVPKVANTNFLTVDILDLKSLRKAFTAIKPDVVIHTSGQGNVDYAEKHQAEVWEVNVQGTRNVIKVANEFGSKVIFCSTNGIYDGKSGPYSEKDEGQPVDFYGRTKVESERDVRRSARLYVIVRLMTMFGWNNPFERANPVSGLLPKLRNREELYQVTDTRNNFLYNRVAAKVIWQIIDQKRDHEVFNIAGRDSLSRFDLAKLVAKVFKLPAERIHPVTSDYFSSITPRPLDTTFDITKMIEELGFRPDSLERDLAAMAKDEKTKDNWTDLELDLSSLKGQVILITHAVMYEKGDIAGPPHAVSKFLKDRGVDHWFIRHPLWGDWPTLVDYVSSTKSVSYQVKLSTRPLIRYISEAIWNFRFLTSHRAKVVIGVDPLNAMVVAVLKLFGRVKQFVFFSADFALVRFESPVMNFIYHSLDRLANRVADFCWSVSTRIVDYKLNQGVQRFKNLHIPNAPFFNKIKRLPLDQIKRFDLVIVSGLVVGIDFNIIFSSLKELAKKFPKIRLLIIGGGEGEAALRSAVKKYDVEERVVFLGRMPHEQVHEVLSKAGIGIALYTDSAAWRWFSDSMKARDYMATGLPVIISGDTSTTADIQAAGAGREVKLNKKEIVDTLTELLGNDAAYKTARENALKLAKANDIEQVLIRAFSRLDI